MKLLLTRKYNLITNSLKQVKKELDSEHEAVYCTFNTSNYTTEFECLSNEKRIGIYTKLNKINSIICLELLKMLYQRNYKFLLYIYSGNNFVESLDDTNFWRSLLKNHFRENKINITRSNDLPIPLKNYKAKTQQKFFTIDEITNQYYSIKL
jgi:hypothetical protein